ncbi:GNAT family N-acetyltransferase, partial [Candidatus Bipolaricaulota bacterium]|nr:GNAT family N-acetyltransferase [Candidatus Bipolaricaulota bacterium]
HWYLMALGVAPGRQGRGIGARLLSPILRRASDEGLPCYLETQTERNVTFYGKLGFEVLLEEREPVGGLPLWFMARQPVRAE